MLGQRHMDTSPELIDIAIRGAHRINNKLFLFEAAIMSEAELRRFLQSSGISERGVQDQYIEFVHMYKLSTL